MRLAIALLLVVLLVGAGLVELRRRWEQPLVIPGPGLRFEVRGGDSLRSIARRLAEADVLPEPALLRIYGRMTGQDDQLQQGEYLIPPGTTPAGLLRLLRQGEVIQYQVTLPEGLTLLQALDVLSGDPVLQHSLNGIEDERIARLTADYPQPEGLFLPETYRFIRGDSDWGVLERAYYAMQDVLAQEWQQRAPDLPLANPYEALILASLIERETGMPSERGEIAGVFIRRLQDGMRLQTDPAVIYGLGNDFDGNLRRTHLRDESNRFNTYRHHGLPPSPIALPGQAAIHAALNPAPGKSLYFVARGDGSHEFSATLEAHERAVRKYQLRRSPDYRSTPED